MLILPPIARVHLSRSFPEIRIFCDIEYFGIDTASFEFKDNRTAESLGDIQFGGRADWTLKTRAE